MSSSSLIAARRTDSTRALPGQRERFSPFSTLTMFFCLEPFSPFSRAFEESPNCDIVMGDGFIVDGSGKRIRHIRAAGFTSARYFYGAATWLQQATFFRREAFASVGGFNVINLSCWDGELMVEMVRGGAKIRYLHRDLALFRVHPRSITGSKRHGDMMRVDMDRMFRRASGRGWTGLDALRTRLFRIERLLTHRGALESAIKGRLHKT